MKKLLFQVYLLLTIALILPQISNAQTPTWYQAFQPRNEVVNGLNSYGIPDLNNNGDLRDDLNLILGSTDPKADVDADDDRGTANDVQVYTEYINGDRDYLPGEYWRSTPSEKEGWFRAVYPIAVRLNNYEFIPPSDPRSQNNETRFDSDNGAVGDFLALNGYNPNRDDFNLIHQKYNLDHNGLFNLPVYIARVHSDDGNFNHGIIALFKGTNLNNPDDWLFGDAYVGRVVEPGIDWSIPFNSRVDVLGVKDFKSAYDVGVIDLPWLNTAISIHFDGEGNREITYMNPNMIEDQTSLAVRDNENTNISDNYLLKQNFPNPFNSTTQISYELPQNSNVELIIYNILGKEIIKLVNRNQAIGRYNINWNGQNLFGEHMPGGIYLYTLRTKDFTKTRKMLLLR